MRVIKEDIQSWQKLFLFVVTFTLSNGSWNGFLDLIEFRTGQKLTSNLDHFKKRREKRPAPFLKMFLTLSLTLRQYSKCGPKNYVKNFATTHQNINFWCTAEFKIASGAKTEMKISQPVIRMTEADLNIWRSADIWWSFNKLPSFRAIHL